MATRGTWTVERKIATVWTDEGDTIYRPNANINVERISTQVRTILADGSYAYITPETKYNPTSLKMTWAYLPKTYKTQLETYVNNLYDLRITDHNATIYYGRFINIKSTWLTGESDKYDIAVEFQLMPAIA